MSNEVNGVVILDVDENYEKDFDLSNMNNKNKVNKLKLDNSMIKDAENYVKNLNNPDEVWESGSKYPFMLSKPDEIIASDNGITNDIIDIKSIEV